MDLFLGRLTPLIGESVILTKPNPLKATTIRMDNPGNDLVHLKTLLLLALLGSTGLFASGPNAAERLYKVIDQNGRVSYQDRPPLDDKSTVLKKSFENRSNRVQPDNSTTDDRATTGDSKPGQNITSDRGGESNTTKGLSSEELTAIAIGESLNDSSDDQPSASEEAVDGGNDATLTTPPGSGWD